MSSRGVLGGFFLVTVGLGAAIACSDYTPPDVANYGPPNGLDSHTPGAPSGSGSGSSTSSGSGSGSGGTVPTGDGGASEGGTSAPALACVTAGGTLVAQTTPCTVSWENDIYPKMLSGAAWNCASSSCHGGGSTTPPVLSGTTADDFYTTLANFTATVASGTGAGQPYINPCSTSPSASEFVCNTQPTGYCGVSGMPLTGGPIADAGLNDIATWVACGAPEN